MNILLVSPYLPHPKSGHGTGVFMYGLLQHLSPKHSITLLTFCDKKELSLAEGLKDLPIELITVPRGRGAQKNILWNLYLITMRLMQLARSIILWQPYYVSKFRHPRMTRLVRSLTTQRNYDIVQFEMSQMAQYVRFVAKGKTVLHEHDVSFRPAYRQYKGATSMAKRFIYYIEWCRWSLYEQTMAKKFDHVLCVTEQDVQLIRWLAGMNRASYFPRGVDVPKNIPSYSSREPLSLIFLGTFSHRPNADAAVWLAREIFPLVLEKFPAAKLYLIGAHAPQELHSLAAAMPQMHVLGFVDDVEVYLRRCSIFIAPLRFGGGVKIKILHAMAHGIPVVTTKIGIEGIEGVSSETALIGDTAERLSECIVTLLTDTKIAERIGNNGYIAIRKSYSWESVVARLEGIYNRVIQINEMRKGSL